MQEDQGVKKSPEQPSICGQLAFKHTYTYSQASGQLQEHVNDFSLEGDRGEFQQNTGLKWHPAHDTFTKETFLSSFTLRSNVTLK